MFVRLVSLAPFVLYSSVVVINDIHIKCEQSIYRMIYDQEVAGSILHRLKRVACMACNIYSVCLVIICYEIRVVIAVYLFIYS